MHPVWRGMLPAHARSDASIGLADAGAVGGALIEGHYAVDYVQRGQSQIYYVRPAISGRDMVIDAAWGGRCVFLSDDGCRLHLRHRPAQCRGLEPRMGGFGYGVVHCWGHGSQRMLIDAWLPHQDEVRAIIRIVARRKEDA
jgi:hypothetical protein